MAAVIIREKDLDRLAKETLKEVFDFLNNDYIVTTFEEMKEEQKVLLQNLVLNHIKTLHRQFKITKEKRDELIETFRSKLFEYDSQLVKDAMEDKGVDTEGIYFTLLDVKLIDELEEDLHAKKHAFLDIYRVFDSRHNFL